MTTTTTRSAAADLLDSLSRGDFEQLAGCFTDDVHLRALVPPGPFELHGPADVAAQFRRWFGQDEGVELLDSDVAQVGSKVRLRWCIQVGTERLVEQTAFARIGERIEAMDLLCSGWQVFGA